MRCQFRITLVRPCRPLDSRSACDFDSGPQWVGNLTAGCTAAAATYEPTGSTSRVLEWVQEAAHSWGADLCGVKVPMTNGISAASSSTAGPIAAAARKTLQAVVRGVLGTGLDTCLACQAPRICRPGRPNMG